MDHPRSKLPAVLAILFCIALLGGVGVLLWKTLPEKQQPQQAETIQTDSVFSSEQTAVEPEREAPYEGELPEQAEAAQPEQPDSEQPSEPAADPAAPDDTPVTDAQKTAQATLASMTEDEKLWQLFFVTPEAITNVNTATVAGEATKKCARAVSGRRHRLFCQKSRRPGAGRRAARQHAVVCEDPAVSGRG